MRSRSIRFTAVAGLAIVSALAGLALAAEVDEAPAEPTSAESPTVATGAPPQGAGMVAYIDPETGRLTSSPTAAQRAEMQAELAAVLDRSQDGLFDVVLPDGSVMRDLQGRFQNAVVVRVAADGKLGAGCVTDAERALAPAPHATELQPAAAATE